MYFIDFDAYIYTFHIKSKFLRSFTEVIKMLKQTLQQLKLARIKHQHENMLLNKKYQENKPMIFFLENYIKQRVKQRRTGHSKLPPH